MKKGLFWKFSYLPLVIFALCTMLLAGCDPSEDDEPDLQHGDIVILYDNDVHCQIDGYAKMASLKNATLTQTDYVCVVSCGDFVQGESYGLLTRGEYPIRLMNAVGYDFVTVGNHEFDYSVSRLFELMDMLTANVLCVNFTRLSDGNPVFSSSAIKEFGDTKVAFIGVATPYSVTTSTPCLFQDDEGNMLYSFNESSIVDLVQNEIDRQHQAGADYVVVLSHLGSYSGDYITSQELISQTSGIDVLLDGHSHTIIECDSIRDKSGHFVKRSSTGSYFTSIGRLTISPDGTIRTKLIPTQILYEDAAVKEEVNRIKQEFDGMLSETIGQSSVLLTISDAQGVRIVRKQESNLGDLCADAMRDYFGADIGWYNGGGIRCDIQAGPITFEDVLNVSPYGNQCVYGRITGQVLLDNLEMSYRRCPIENGGFAQLSGVRCEIDTSIQTSVSTDANGVLSSVGATRRVRNVYILNRSTGNYEPINPNKVYTIAGSIYVIQNQGDGQNFSGVQLINDHDVLTDAQILVRYIRDVLHGTIGQQYANPQGRIQIIGNNKRTFC